MKKEKEEKKKEKEKEKKSEYFHKQSEKRKEKEKNKKGQDYSDSSGDTVFTKKNRCLIFLKNNDININDPKTYRKWMLENHPDKLYNFSEEEKEKRLVLLKRVTDCWTYLNQ